MRGNTHEVIHGADGGRPMEEETIRRRIDNGGAGKRRVFDRLWILGAIY